jgi:uncharacterized protein (TIGR02453 family)
VVESASSFSGFPVATLEFLTGIAANNNKEWFTANRALYDASVEGAKAFVEAVGPALRTIAPSINFEAKIGASLPRVNRDTRLAKTKLPYKEQLDLWFWHGVKKSFEQPGYYVRIEPEAVYVAAGMMHILWPTLATFREAVVDERAGAALVEAVRRVSEAGPYQVGYPSRRSVPKGYDKAAPRAEYLLYESLWAHLRLPSEAVLEAHFAEVALRAWRDMSPIPEWLLAEVTGPRT